MPQSFLFSIVVIYICFSISSCKNENGRIEEREKTLEISEIKIVKPFNWLIGSWKRTNDTNELQTFENWCRSSDNKLLGHGFVCDDNDTIWQEKMRFYKYGNGWTFAVFTPENNDTVHFELSQHSDTSFIVENRANEFPNYIHYVLDKNKLMADVYGDFSKTKLIFEFEKIKKAR